MPDEPNEKIDLLRLGLDSYRDEYRELCNQWQNLDTKAQGTGAIAGIFLAAAVAWSRNMSDPITRLEGGLLVSTVATLVFSIVLTVFAMRIRTITAPPLGDSTTEMVKDLTQINVTGEIKERIPRFLQDQISLWRDCNEETQKQNLSKARKIWCAQITLLIAACLVSVLLGVTLVRSLF
ncbi:MAG: hypothetical protein WBN92_20700 [Terriglobia bacterium]